MKVGLHGVTALSNDFAQMKYGGMMYIGIPNPYEQLHTPAQSGGGDNAPCGTTWLGVEGLDHRNSANARPSLS